MLIRTLAQHRSAQPATWVLPDRAVATLGLLALCALYVAAYLGDSKLPGVDPGAPLGWWGWFDQSQTLRSTAALAQGDLRPSEHHYPFGYALMAVPFWFLSPSHAFAIVNLFWLLAAYAGFVSLAGRLGMPALVAAPLFILAAVMDPGLFRQWVLPWNTTPVGGAVWLVLATAAAWLDGVRRPVALGVLSAVVVACRPSDGLFLLPALAAVAWVEFRARRIGGLARSALAGALTLSPFVVLHLATYGLQPSLYMRISSLIGFTTYDLGWKAYVLLANPYAWFADGEGLLQRAPWMAVALPGALVALLRSAKDRVLAATLLIHALFYLSYVDLLPVGFWRFMNVHYWVWAIPGYALAGVLLMRDLVAGSNRARSLALASSIAAAVVLCLRIEPRPADAGQPAKAVDFAGPLPPFLQTYFGELALRDDWGTLYNNRDVRAFIFPGGVRVVALRRDIQGPLHWLPDQAPPGFDPAAPQTRIEQSVRLRWPTWTSRAPAPSIPIPVE